MYLISFLQAEGLLACTVEVFQIWSENHTVLRVHFVHYHMKGKMVIM